MPGTPADALPWLVALEEAWTTLVEVQHAPAPLSDFAAGGGPELDLYLAPGASGVRAAPDEAYAVARDATSAWCQVGAEYPAPRRAASLCIGEAVAHRLDSAEPDASRSALAAHLWLRSGRVTSEDALELEEAQRSPWRGVFAGEDAGPTTLLYAYLDGARGTGQTPLAMHALGGGGATNDPVRFENEPDLWDVFRASYGPKPTELGAAYAGYAVASALLGRQQTTSQGAWAPTEARVGFDWAVPWSSLPRRLLGKTPVEPLGSMYVWVDLDEPPGPSSLAMRAEWEGPGAFVWTLVTVDARGALLGRFDAPTLERSRRADRTVVDLAGARGVIVAGTNLGNVGATYPFDPDFAPHEPHAATVYLAKLAP